MSISRPYSRRVQRRVLIVDAPMPRTLTPRAGTGQCRKRNTPPLEARSSTLAGLLSQSPNGDRVRSEEHTSELQSRSDLVCRLLLEKKKKKKHIFTTNLR